MRDARGHDLALERPIVEVLQIAAEDAEHQLDAEVFQHREIEQRFRQRGLWQDSGLDEHEENFPAELRDVLQDLAEVVLLAHQGQWNGKSGEKEK